MNVEPGSMPIQFNTIRPTGLLTWQLKKETVKLSPYLAILLHQGTRNDMGEDSALINFASV